MAIKMNCLPMLICLFYPFLLPESPRAFSDRLFDYDLTPKLSGSNTV